MNIFIKDYYIMEITLIFIKKNFILVKIILKYSNILTRCLKCYFFYQKYILHLKELICFLFFPSSSLKKMLQIFLTENPFKRKIFILIFSLLFI